MKRYIDATYEFLAEEDGPTAVEYAVMLALIVVACLSSISALAFATQQNFNDSASAIDGAFNP
ncbi:MAG: Flp family type IVb pilin [Planctomycetota bacterium]